MARRYADILRAPELKAAYDKFMAWSGKTPGEKSTLYDTLNVQKQSYTRTDAWVVPFSAAGLQFFVGIKAPTDGGGQERSALAAALEFSAAASSTGRVKTAAPAATAVTISQQGLKFKPAKLTLTRLVTAASAKSESRITGNKYFRHQTDSCSCYFGKKDAADTFEDATAAIITATATFKAADKRNRVVIVGEVGVL